MIIKTVEDFENKEQYIEHLETNGLISNGCARCMAENGICEDATRKYADREDFVYDIPFSNLDEEMRFPVSCLTEWYGRDYVDCIREDEKSEVMTLHDILTMDSTEVKASLMEKFSGLPDIEERLNFIFGN